MVDSKTEPPDHAERLKAQNIRYAEAETARLAAQKSVEAEETLASKESPTKKTKSCFLFLV